MSGRVGRREHRRTVVSSGDAADCAAFWMPARRPSAGAALILYYDGDCRFCTACVRCLSRLDWRDRISWEPWQNMASLPGGLTSDDMGRAAYLEDDRGDIHEGFFAFRRLLVELPVLIPLGLLMWLPGLHLIGVPLYRLVARNRRTISGC